MTSLWPPGEGLGSHTIQRNMPQSNQRGERLLLSGLASGSMTCLPLWAEETVPAAVPTTALSGQGSLALWRPLTACGSGLLTIPTQATHQALSSPIKQEYKLSFKEEPLCKLPHPTKGSVKVDCSEGSQASSSLCTPSCNPGVSNPQRPPFPISIILWVN